MQRTNDERNRTQRLDVAALRIAAIYAVAALVWIYASDFALEVAYPDSLDSVFAHNLKGTLFVLVTAGVLYVAIRASTQREFLLTARLQSAMDATRDGLWRWNLGTNDIEVTPGGDADLGWDAAGSIRDPKSWRAVVHPDDWQKVAPALETLKQNGGIWQIEQRFLTDDGGWHWYAVNGAVTAWNSDGTPSILEGVYHSIDDLKRAQLALERSNRAMQILLCAYEAVSSGKNGPEALLLLVQGVADSSDCPVAWIGEAINDEQKHIVPIAWAGPAADFARGIELRWDDSKYASGPSGMCVKTGRPCMVTDAFGNDDTAAWQADLSRFGIRSGVSVPIRTKEGTVYVLHVAGNTPNQFSVDDLDTYETIAKVLALIMETADAEFRFTQSEIARQEISTRLQRAVNGSIEALATVVETRDPYTAGHQQRVADLAVAIGAEMNLDADRLEALRIGASIHDIGKIGVPTEILSKPGRLDETEIALIRRHAQIGFEIVNSIDFGWPVEKIVHQHHERWDGSGYPQGLVGEAINLDARIVAVADVIESMGTNRPYRPSIPWQVVLEEITSGRGVRYDPDVVDAALVILDREATQFGFAAE